MEGCQKRAQTSSLHDGLTSRQLQMCCADGYESILGFSFPWCHQTLLHRAKITMSSWHSVLPIHMSSHNISRITHLFSPKILHLNQRHLFRYMCHSLVLPQLTQYIVVAHCFLGDLDIFMDWARTLLRTPRLRLSVLWTTPAAGKPFYMLGSLIICGILHQINII